MVSASAESVESEGEYGIGIGGIGIGKKVSVHHQYLQLYTYVFAIKRPENLFALRSLRKITHNVIRVPEQCRMQFLIPFLGDQAQPLLLDRFEPKSNDFILQPQETLTPNFIKIGQVLLPLSQKRRTHTNKCTFPPLCKLVETK